MTTRPNNQSKAETCAYPNCGHNAAVHYRVSFGWRCASCELERGGPFRHEFVVPTCGVVFYATVPPGITKPMSRCILPKGHDNGVHEPPADNPAEQLSPLPIGGDVVFEEREKSRSILDKVQGGGTGHPAPAPVTEGSEPRVMGASVAFDDEDGTLFAPAVPLSPKEWKHGEEITITVTHGARAERTPVQPSEDEEQATLADLGATVLDDILNDEFFFQSEESERWCEILQELGYVERTIYDPAKHGEIDDVDAGQDVWIFTEKMKKAARR